MQNKLYAVQFPHHLMTDSQSVPEQQSKNLEIKYFRNLTKFPKKMKLLENFELKDKRGF